MADLTQDFLNRVPKAILEIKDRNERYNALYHFMENHFDEACEDSRLNGENRWVWIWQMLGIIIDNTNYLDHVISGHPDKETKIEKACFVQEKIKGIVYDRCQELTSGKCDRTNNKNFNEGFKTGIGDFCKILLADITKLEDSKENLDKKKTDANKQIRQKHIDKLFKLHTEIYEGRYPFADKEEEKLWEDIWALLHTTSPIFNYYRKKGFELGYGV